MSKRTMSETEHLKYLEVLQSTIARMAQNSFLLKSWAVALVTGIMALGTKDADPSTVLLAAVPAVVLWGLDAYYLALERRFRRLYDDVRVDSTVDAPFSLDASRYAANEPVAAALWRASVWPLYVSLLLIIAAVAVRYYGLTR